MVMFYLILSLGETHRTASSPSCPSGNSDSVGLVNNAPSCDFGPLADLCEDPVLYDGVGVWDACIPSEAEYGGLEASMAARMLVF